jgi:DnaJ family protein A protein 2
MTYKLYSALGLNRNNNPDQNEIKKAYKKMAMEYHPDKNKENPKAEEKFKEISNAYAVLADEEKKRIYDQVGDEGYAEREGMSQGNNMNHADIFEHFFRSHNNPFAQHFGFDFDEMRGNNHNNHNKNCASIHKQLNISLEEAFEGVNKNMNISVTKYCMNCMTTCVNCNGTGVVKQIKHMGILTQVFQGRCDKCSGAGHSINGKKSCSECNGNGKYSQDMHANLSLPKGVASGIKTAFPELGEQPRTPNQKPGDLILEIIVNEHSLFRRNQNDLHYKCDLTYIESIVGKDIVIPYFKESIKLNTNMFGIVYPGKSYMIENKGMPIVDTNKFGNMYIEFDINYPKIKKIDKVSELEALLRETFQL